MKRLTAAAAALIILLACGCARENEKKSVSFAAMDTLMTLTACGGDADAALKEAESELHRLEGLLSVTLPDSEISRLNAHGSGELSDDCAAVIKKAAEIYELTGGRFDITVSPTVDAWGFYTDDYRVPSEEELAALAALTDGSLVKLSGNHVSLGEGQRIDLGGIAKGCAADKVLGIMRSHGVSSGIIALGGNILLFGRRPDGGAWRTAIRSPDDPDGYIGTLSATDTSIVTSGAYQRYFERDGVRWHHIFDPAEARPADSDLASVTVVCPDSALADGLSTALFVMGCDEAAEFWRRHSGMFQLVLYTVDGRMYVTKGLEDCFSSEMSYEIIDIHGDLR
ncbi:MAG: FAD:protein FMN transferase [Oscillospiraceae bacterium]|jgi:thiamine biosynthesis lipoprotein|nr:FAD:protein FMN transferase [Oscillospiraceae bacterium]